MTIGHVKVREQFGRPIGSFQAIKHKCANMRIWAQASAVATYYAAMAVDAEAADRNRAVSVAKTYVSDAVSRLAGEALQAHGEGSGLPGSMTYTCTCGGPRATSCCTATRRGTVSGSASSSKRLT